MCPYLGDGHRNRSAASIPEVESKLAISFDGDDVRKTQVNKRCVIKLDCHIEWKKTRRNPLYTTNEDPRAVKTHI